MTVPASHCEAKLHAFRKTQDGVVVSFVLHPAEVPERLALDPLGTRYMLALVAIGDDEQPAPEPAPESKHKARYRTSTQMEQARDRAAILCADPAFQDWYSGTRNEADTAAILRDDLLIASRSEIAT